MSYISSTVLKTFVLLTVLLVGMFLEASAVLAQPIGASVGGCNTYTPTQGQSVVCDPAGTPSTSGIQIPENDKANNDVTVFVQSGVILNINGSTIGLGSGTEVTNAGTLYTRSFRYGYGISAGVNGRSTAGDNTITNQSGGVIQTDGADAHAIYVNARQATALGNTITNRGSIVTNGDRADGIRLLTSTNDLSVINRVFNWQDITTNGSGSHGINVQNTTGVIRVIQGDGVFGSSAQILVTGTGSHGIYSKGAIDLVIDALLSSTNGYAIYLDSASTNTSANTVTIQSNATIIGGLMFDTIKSTDKLVFDGFNNVNFSNSITGLNNIDVINGAAVNMTAGSYDFGGSEINVASGLNLEITGQVVGATAITKLGDGTLIFSGANTYTGDTVVGDGTLITSATNRMSSQSAVTVAAGALLDINDFSQVIGSLAGSGSVDLGTGTLSTGGNGFDTTFSGTITGSGGLVKQGTGVFALSGANTYTGGTNVITGTLGLGSDTAAGTGTIVMQDLTTLQAAADLTLTNLIDLKGAVTFDTQGYSMTINTGITNAVGGQLIKTGLGTLTLNGVNTYTAGTIVQEGTLALYGSLASGVEVQSGAIFGGTGTVTGDVTNAGTLQPRLNGSRSTLTLIGNYVGQGGTFATTLSGTPDAIEADRLAIQGAGNTASGTTTISVADPDGLLGKPIEGDGVLLVQFTGATGGPDAFTAPRIAAGAYEYVVERGGSTSSENWYLRSDIDEPQPPVVITPERTQREEVALYPSLPSLARQYLWSINGTLDDRRGAPELLGQWHRQPVAWGRLIAQGNELEPGNLDNGPGLKSNDWGLQLGADLWRRDSDWGQWRAGPVLTMGRSTGQAYNTTGAVQTGSVSLSAYSLGLNATVASQAGAYADLLLMGTRLAGVNANSPLGTSINTTGWALSGSIEGGWQIPMNSRVTITPQAQLYLTSVNLATTEDAYATIQMPTQTTTLGRLGLKLAYDNAEAGQPHTQFWVRASLFSTLSGQDAPTSFLNLAGTNPTTFHSQAPSTWMTIDAALNLKATDSTSVQLGLGYQTSFNSQYRGVYGQVNLRIGF